MDPRVQTIIGFLAWSVLRIGIPILITALIVLWLKELDLRWRAEGSLEAEEEPQVPCWEVRKCPPQLLEHCPAYADKTAPCWQVFRAREGQLRQACLSCTVFRNAPAPLPVPLSRS